MQTNDDKLTAFIKNIGDILLIKYGKEQFYLPEEVSAAHAESTWRDDADLANMARATFCTFSNFENFHQQTKNPLDYGEMRDAIFMTLSNTLSIQEIEKYGIPIETGNYPKNIKDDLDNLVDALYHFSDIFD